MVSNFKSRAPRGERFLVVESSVSLSYFLQFFCEIRLVVETMLKNIRCFIAFIVILVLGSFRKQGIVFSFSALEYEVEKIK